MNQFGMLVSDDIIFWYLKCMVLQIDDEFFVWIIGIDDWSWRKLWCYGMIIVDFEC